MSPDRDLAARNSPSARDLATVPDRPQIEPREMYSGGPFILGLGSDESYKHGIGWIERSARLGGPCFVVVKVTFTGTFRTLERFPLTDAGWARAWKALVRQDREAAALALAALEARDRAAALRAEVAGLAAQTIVVLPTVTYVPGSGDLPDLGYSGRIEVRFLAGSMVFVPPGEARRLAEFSYADIVDVEVGGPGRVQRFTPGQQMALGFALGIGAELVASQMTKVKTVVRFGTTKCELFVVSTQTDPDVLRMQLSPALWAIREARGAAGRPSPDGGHPTGAAQVVDQLAKLASLLEAGLLTRQEFDNLKSALLAGPDAGENPGPDAGDPPLAPGWPGPGAG